MMMTMMMMMMMMMMIMMMIMTTMMMMMMMMMTAHHIYDLLERHAEGEVYCLAVIEDRSLLWVYLLRPCFMYTFVFHFDSNPILF